jgi:hypothetical protein
MSEHRDRVGRIMKQLEVDFEEVERHSHRGGQPDDPVVRAIEFLSGRDIALQVAVANLARIVADLDPDPDPGDRHPTRLGPCAN